MNSSRLPGLQILSDKLTEEGVASGVFQRATADPYISIPFREKQITIVPYGEGEDYKLTITGYRYGREENSIIGTVAFPYVVPMVMAAIRQEALK